MGEFIMVKIRMIKAMPGFPKGQIGEMKNKEHEKFLEEELIRERDKRRKKLEDERLIKKGIIYLPLKLQKAIR
jgi:hypothetical protein